MIYIREETMLSVVAVTAIVAFGLYLGYKYMEYEIERHQQRIRQLAKILQIAEEKTGYPFYTSVLHNAQPFEYPEQLYTRIQQKLMSAPVLYVPVPAPTPVQRAE